MTYRMGLNVQMGCVPWTPAALPGIDLWLRADKGIELTSGKVSTWYDYSGSAHHVTQSDGPTRPTLVEAIIGGHSVVRFVGVQKLLSANVDWTDTANCTIFLVTACNEPLGLYAVTKGAPGTLEDISILLNYNVARRVTLLSKHSSDSRYYTISEDNAMPTNGTAFVFSGTIDQSQSSQAEFAAWVNGAPLTWIGGTWSDTNSNFTNSAYMIPASGGAGYIDIAEVIVCKTNLSTAVRREVEGYISRRYGITVV